MIPPHQHRCDRMTTKTYSLMYITDPAVGNIFSRRHGWIIKSIC